MSECLTACVPHLVAVVEVLVSGWAGELRQLLGGVELVLAARAVVEPRVAGDGHAAPRPRPRLLAHELVNTETGDRVNKEISWLADHNMKPRTQDTRFPSCITTKQLVASMLDGMTTFAHHRW